jgi:hypothetical protein
MNRDFRDFFATLQAHGVEFLLIGGVAYNFYAPPRATKDIDVWVRPTTDNLARLIEAIGAFGFPTDALSVEQLAGEKGQVLMLGRVPNRIDVLTRPAGLTWDSAWEGRVLTSYDDLELALLDIRTLIAAKRAAGRPRDLADAAKLEEILRRRSQP